LRVGSLQVEAEHAGYRAAGANSEKGSASRFHAPSLSHYIPESVACQGPYY
jgi:hypothetical protein